MTNREKRWLRSQGKDPDKVQAERLNPSPPPTLEEAHTSLKHPQSLFRSFTLKGDPGTKFEAGQELMTGEGHAYVMIETVEVPASGTIVGETIRLSDMRGVRPDIAKLYDQRKSPRRRMDPRAGILLSSLLFLALSNPGHDPDR